MKEWEITHHAAFVSVHRIGEWPLVLPHMGEHVDTIVFYGAAVLDRRHSPRVQGWGICDNAWARGPIARVSCAQGTIYMLPKWGDAWPIDNSCPKEPWLTLPVGMEEPCQN